MLRDARTVAITEDVEVTLTATAGSATNLHILRQLGISKIRLLTNNPGKRAALARLGVEVVERVKHAFPPNPHNAAYLRTKAVRDGHNF